MESLFCSLISKYCFIMGVSSAINSHIFLPQRRRISPIQVENFVEK